MFFRTLLLEDFPPFAPNQKISFPDVEASDIPLAETHVITGINGTGKTRLLSVLAAVLGNDEHIAKRWPNPKGNIHVNKLATNPAINPMTTRWCYLKKDPENGILTFPQDHASFGETLAFAYNGSAYVQDAPIKVMAPSLAPDAKTRLSFARPPDQSNTLLQNIANLKIKSALDNQDSAQLNKSIPIKLVQQLEAAVSEITGKSFAFQMEFHDDPKIHVRWGDAENLQFSLLPDGLRSIIGWLAHAVVMLDACLKSKSDATEHPAVFLFDEPESHLHPAWQRKIFPAFQRLFPKSQIIVSTHSPFIISSINHGWIHRLEFVNGKVEVNREPAKTGDNYKSVAKDLMGIDEAMAFDPKSEELLRKFYTVREAAYQRQPGKIEEAAKIAEEIASRGPLLGFIAGNEMAQMRRQLAEEKVEG